MKQADAPITGFVNQKGLEVDGEVDPARLARSRIGWTRASTSATTPMRTRACTTSACRRSSNRYSTASASCVRSWLACYGKTPRDAAYQRADGYYGKWGPSWIHRWVMAEKRPKSFFAGEPPVPKCVMEMAGVEGG